MPPSFYAIRPWWDWNRPIWTSALKFHWKADGFRCHISQFRVSGSSDGLKWWWHLFLILEIDSIFFLFWTVAQDVSNSCYIIKHDLFLNLKCNNLSMLRGHQTNVYLKFTDVISKTINFRHEISILMFKLGDCSLTFVWRSKMMAVSTY